MASKSSMISSFIEAAPPGELSDVVADVKLITADEPNLLESQETAFKKYNETQFATVKLPGGSQEVVVCEHSDLGDGRYYDVESQSSFDFNHTTRQASAVQSYALESQHKDLIQSLAKGFKKHASEHFPASSVGVYPVEDDSKVALVLVANKYSPNNFWNGRWRSQYLVDPSSGSITGAINVDVHYYEDGNVRLLTDKNVSESASSSATASEIVRQVAVAERKYQEDLNRAFGALSEGAFKGLRRQLPVTRQKIDWSKTNISGYRLGQDIAGGRQR